MILVGWEISKEADGSYRASERKMGKDGYGNSVNQLSGPTLVGTLEIIHTQLAAWKMQPSKLLPKTLAGKEILEFWW